MIYDSENQCYRTQNLALFRMDSNGELSSDCCEHILVLTDKNTGQELIRGNIYNYLVRNADAIDVTKQEAELPIAIEFNGVNAEIKLPDWVIVDGKPEWN
mgnify:FL=1